MVEQTRRKNSSHWLCTVNNILRVAWSRASLQQPRLELLSWRWRNVSWHQSIFYSDPFQHCLDVMAPHIFWSFLLQVKKKHGRKSKKKSVRSQPKAAPTTQKRTYSHTRTRQQWICLIVAIILGIILLPLSLAAVIGFYAGWAFQSCKDRAIQRELRKAYLETKRQREAEQEAVASTSGMIVMEWNA